jgi:tripartite-type tricarboxylate transporter receptor subunit TctC
MQNILRTVVVVAASLAGLAPALAQYPTKPVRLIVPFAPGGPTDTAARIVGQKLGEQMNQSFVVENKPGADGLIGAESVAKSAADGYVLLVANDAILTINPVLYAKLPYDPVKSFAAISMLTRQPYLISVNAKSPFKSLPDLLDYAKAHPGKLNYGAGATNPMMAGELFKITTGTHLELIRFKGAAPNIQALLSETIDVAFSDIGTAHAHIRQGRLRAIATTGLHRATSLPDVPTVAESYPGFELHFWNGLVAPSGTTKEIVDKLSREVRAALEAPDIGGKLRSLGYDAKASSPEEFAAFIATDTEKWRKVVAATGVRLD